MPIITNRPNLFRLPIFLAGLLLASIALLGCAPPAYTARPVPAPHPPPPATVVNFYPSQGQSEVQQDRDRYECYLWAVKQTGFDPGQAQLAPHQRIEVRPASPPGSGTAAGAVGGAIVGSMVAPRHEQGFGLVFGALTGAMMGAASEAAQQQQARQIQQAYNAREAQHYARVEKRARDYQRAMTACLEGRGYTVH
jgi:hypothetical protein